MNVTWPGPAEVWSLEVVCTVINDGAGLPVGELGDESGRRVLQLAEMRDARCREGAGTPVGREEIQKRSWSQIAERAGSQDLGLVLSLGPRAP